MQTNSLEEVVNKIKEDIKEKNDAKHLIYIASRNLEIEKHLIAIDSLMETIEKYTTDNKVSEDVQNIAFEIDNKEELEKVRDKFCIYNDEDTYEFVMKNGYVAKDFSYPYAYNGCATASGTLTPTACTQAISVLKGY